MQAITSLASRKKKSKRCPQITCRKVCSLVSLLRYRPGNLHDQERLVASHLSLPSRKPNVNASVLFLLVLARLVCTFDFSLCPWFAQSYANREDKELKKKTWDVLHFLCGFLYQKEMHFLH